jgi:hypothetical protein
MGKLLAPKPVKLFLGMISREPELFTECMRLFVQEFGPVDLESRVMPWDHSEYYREEMGTGLQRMFIFFEKPADPELLAAAKHHAIGIEESFSEPVETVLRRRINLDPGYLTEAKVVLSTTKDFPHRIYIGRSIYAESTLHYHKDSRSFQPVEHTYPDFRTEYCLRLFSEARGILRSRLQR